MLYTLYITGFKKHAVDLAVKWYATKPIESKKSSAGGSFIEWQKKYPLCEYCTWPLYPNDVHDYCDEQLRLEDDGWIDPSDYDDLYDGPELDEWGDGVSTTNVYSRAYAHFGGNTELAREAAELYPGDFI